MPVLESPSQVRVGHFASKNQPNTLLSFIGDAYLNEKGITNRLRPKDTTNECKTTSDPKDKPDELGLADIGQPHAQTGQRIFEAIGYNICHLETIITAPPRKWSNGVPSRCRTSLATTSSIPLAISYCMT